MSLPTFPPNVASPSPRTGPRQGQPRKEGRVSFKYFEPDKRNRDLSCACGAGAGIRLVWTIQSIRLLCAWIRCLVSYVGSMPRCLCTYIRTDARWDQISSQPTTPHQSISSDEKMPFLISVVFHSVVFQFLLWLITWFPFFFFEPICLILYTYFVTVVHSHTISCDGNCIHCNHFSPTFSFVHIFSQRCNLSIIYILAKYFLRVLILLALTASSFSRFSLAISFREYFRDTIRAGACSFKVSLSIAKLQ